MLSGHHVTCRQRGRPLPKGLQGLYQKGTLLKEIVWKRLSIRNCVCGTHRLEEWCPCFQPKGMKGEQLCSNVAGTCERRGVLEDECCLDGQSLRWHLAGEIQEAAGLPWCRTWETLTWESQIWGFYPNGGHLLESLLGSCLRGRFRGPTGRFCFCTVSSAQKTCILKGSLRWLFWRRTLSAPSEKHSSSVTDETQGENTWREVGWGQRGGIPVWGRNGRSHQRGQACGEIEGIDYPRKKQDKW